MQSLEAKIFLLARCEVDVPVSLNLVDFYILSVRSQSSSARGLTRSPHITTPIAATLLVHDTAFSRFQPIQRFGSHQLNVVPSRRQEVVESIMKRDPRIASIPLLEGIREGLAENLGYQKSEQYPQHLHRGRLLFATSSFCAKNNMSGGSSFKLF